MNFDKRTADRSVGSILGRVGAAGAIVILTVLLAPNMGNASAAAKWTAVQRMHAARQGLGVAAAPCPGHVSTRCVYATGGAGPSGGALKSAEVFNPSTGKWTAIKPMAEARAYAAAASAPCPAPVKGICVYVLGGKTNTDGSAEVFNPGTQKWSAIAPMPGQFAGHWHWNQGATEAPCYDSTKPCLYMVGGAENYPGSSGPFVNSSLSAYDPSTKAWTCADCVGIGSRELTGVATAPCHFTPGDTCAFIFGGDDGATATSFNEEWDGLINDEGALTGMPVVVSALAGTGGPCVGLHSHTCVYALGGTTASSKAIKSAFTYSPPNDKWSALASMNTARAGLGAAVAPCSKAVKLTCLYAVGGHDAAAKVLSSVEEVKL